MKTIAFALTAALACGGFASAQTNSTKTSTKYYVDIDGHIAPANTVGTGLDTTLTFSHDVEVPGATLPAGTYLFTFVSPQAMRITSEDRSKVYATFSILPAARRQDSTRHAQVVFERMPDGATRLIGLYPNGSANGYAPFFKKMHTPPGAPVATSGTKP